MKSFTERTRSFDIFPRQAQDATGGGIPVARNIARWTSEAEFNAAVGSEGFQIAASGLRWPMYPALYPVVRTG